ncbi:MAG TPA: glycosyltransferase family 1 protein, partial [Chthoniobacteraceae bacterium]|nr:glycosyltransferase family 1 protein [Chthoniobacteraceae bacterium]
MIRVALSASVIQRGKSGVASYVFGLLEGLRAVNAPVDLTILGFADDHALFEPWLDRFRWQPVDEYWRPAIRNIFWHHARLPALLRKLRTEVLHIPSYRRIVWNPPAAQVVTVHDCAAFAVAGKYDDARMFYGRQVVSRLARRADAVMTVSRASAADITRYFKAPNPRVIWNGIDHALFKPAPGETIAAELQKSFRQTNPYFLYLARLEHPAKNHVRLIEAFEKFAAAHPDRREDLLFGGADWHGANVIHQRIDTSPLRGRIRSLGFVGKSDLPLLYGGATAMVYPSLFEGFGLPPIEAMACGCPVVCSPAGSLREVAGDAAHLVDPEDSGDMALGMAAVPVDGPERERWRRRGIEHASIFCWENVATAVVETYAAAAASSHAPAQA